MLRGSVVAPPGGAEKLLLAKPEGAPQAGLALGWLHTAKMGAEAGSLQRGEHSTPLC